MLAYFAEVLAHRLKLAGIEPRRASEIALAVMEHMKFEFGGQNIYFPKGVQEKVADKAEQIHDAFMAGTSIEDLAHQFGHSVQWIYRLIADERARRKAEREAQREATRVIVDVRVKRLS